MNYYLIKLQYDGTGYYGFQWQRGLPTIQGDLNQRLIELLGGKVTSVGASRTDTGVHAYEQIVKITSEKKIEMGSFLSSINMMLPTQIRCLGIESSEGHFRPTSGYSSKEYRYLFTNQLNRSCVDQKFLANNPYEINFLAMRNCAEKIIGKNSFHNFCSTGSNVKSSQREIYSCELSEVNPHTIFEGASVFSFPPEIQNCYQLRIIGQGFLKQMVRHLMSALWLVGNGKISPEEFSILLSGPIKEKRIWKVASPRGLYLYRILSS